MKNLNKLEKALSESVIIALATSVDNLPNVRVVNFVWDKKEPNIIYFTSDIENNKIKEIDINNKVAIFTIPVNLDIGITLRSNNAIVRKSDKTVKDVQGMFLEKMPSYGEALEHIGDTLTVFEIVLEDALITLDFENTVEITF